MVYVRFPSKGEISVKFFSQEHVEHGTAVNIKAAIDSSLGAMLPEWKSKLVALGSDDAAVMQGKKNRVVKLLQDESPWCQVSYQPIPILYYIGCMGTFSLFVIFQPAFALLPLVIYKNTMVTNHIVLINPLMLEFP